MPSRGSQRVDNTGLVIVVSGAPGSGKSTIARRLAGDLGLRYLSTGSVFRETAKRLGLSLVELSRVAEESPEVDLMIDKKTVEEAMKGGVVIDSHLAAWLIHDIADYLIYTKAPLMVRARRVAERDGVPLPVALEEIVSREHSQWRRFKKYYGIDIRDLGIFNVIIDTATYDREAAYRMAVEGLRLAVGKGLI